MIKKFRKTGKKIINQLFDPNSIIPNLILPVLYLALCCFSFGLILLELELVGKSFYFAIKMSFYLMIFIGCLSIFYVIRQFITKKQGHKGISPRINHRNLRKVDLIFLLLPLTPVTQYIINNLNILTVFEIVKIYAFFLILSSVFAFGLPLLFSRISSKHTLFALGIAFSFTITNIAVLSHNLPWFIHVRVFLPASILVGIFIILKFLHTDKYKKILYAIILINFLFTGISQFISLKAEAQKTETGQINEREKVIAYLSDKDPVTLPNIYLLIYESYVPKETMISYGIDNSAQEEYLVDQGFVIYPGIYSIGSPTIESISRVLNISTQFFGNPRRAVSGDGVVHEIFKKYGYQTYGIFTYDWFFRNINSSYDNSFPAGYQKKTGSDNIIIRSILKGDFSPEIIFENHPKEEYLKAKRSVLGDTSKGKVFFYSHSDLPDHARAMEPGCSSDAIRTYQENLPNANNEMKLDIELILKTNPDAIIIIAGDHGPYLTKNCFGDLTGYPISEITRLDIQDRFATFLAIRWPTEDYEQYDDISILQDLFPAILAYMYEDESILDFKINSDIINTSKINEVTVKDGIIYGGANDGEPLFLINE